MKTKFGFGFHSKNLKFLGMGFRFHTNIFWVLGVGMTPNTQNCLGVNLGY